MARVVVESRLRSRRRRRRLILLGLALLGGILFFGALVWLSWAPFLQLTETHILGTSTVATSSIQTVVDQELAHPYLHLFSKRNTLLYPKQAIVRALLTNIPALASASAEAQSRHVLAVAVVERQPSALWCGDSAAISAFVACRLLDERGLAYAAAPEYSSGVYVKYYGALNDAGQFLTPERFVALHALIDVLTTKANAGTVASVVVDQSDVHTIFASGFALIFSNTDNGGDIMRRFSIALTSGPFAAHSLSDFSYLDLRFGDKLYYKLKAQ